ncbi:glutamate--tRNA ligase [Candidatus Dojkabacteria bacterium]|nr:glutamate--tRNA ligase [Candidatus Dojkabacteria bacterium]
MSSIKTRIAPSPTGGFHVGNFRTALFSYLWARKNDGEFVLRIEDTDQKRFVKGSAEGLIDLFKYFEIEFDGAPDQEQLADLGNVDFPDKKWLLDDKKLDIDDTKFENVYIQTQRLPLYLKYARKLVEEGFAYPCFCSEERLEEIREQQQANKEKVGYDGYCKKHSLEQAKKMVEEGQEYVIRLNVEAFAKEVGKDEVEYEDLFLGKMRFQLEEVDDQVIIKSNGIPTYHLAVVVDDYLMKITHPIRGYGWLPSTPKQILLYNMLGWDFRPFGHATDILDPAGGKLSKRKGAVFVDQFLKDGYLPQALINFMALLGWSPDIEREHGEKEREIFSLDELIELFDVKDVNKSNPSFDRQKLLWFNQQYISDIDTKGLLEELIKWLDKYSEVDTETKNKIFDDEGLEEKLVLVKGRAKTLIEVVEGIEFFYKAPKELDWGIKQIKKYYDKLTDIYEDVFKIHRSLDTESSQWSQDQWVNAMKKVAEKHDLKTGDPFMVLRIAIVGGPFSPPLFEALQILGKDEILERLENAKLP